jgi:hypothetical protein
MFGWFRPQPPLAALERVWVEQNWSWLVQEVGASRMLATRVILPSDEFFPGEFCGSAQDAERIFAQVCSYLNIDAAGLEFVVRDDWIPGHPLGEYVPGERPTIQIHHAELADPESLVATMAHELAHHVLLGGGLVTGNDLELERRTDLLTVFLGVGVFTANSALREQSVGEGQFHYWSITKCGYLPMRLFAYGLALFAWLRQEAKPDWAAYLRPDIQVPFWRGLKYLEKTGDSLLDRNSGMLKARFDSAADCAESLSAKCPSERLLGLIRLVEHADGAALAVPAILPLLSDRNPDIPSLAARVLEAIGPAAESAVPELRLMLASPASEERVAAAAALAAIGNGAPTVIGDLAKLLDDDSPDVVSAAAAAIATLGAHDAAARDRLLNLFCESVCTSKWAVLEPLARAVHRSFDAPLPLVANLLRDQDRGTQQLAYDALQDAAEETAETIDTSPQRFAPLSRPINLSFPPRPGSPTRPPSSRVRRCISGRAAL